MPDDDLAARASRISAASASARAAEPPRTIGQPTAWAYDPEDQPERRRQRSRPAAASSARPGPRTAPAAPSPRNRERASPTAERRAGSPNRARASGWRGTWTTGRSSSCDSSPASRVSGPNSDAPGAGVVRRRRRPPRSPPRTAPGRRPGPASGRGPAAHPAGRAPRRAPPSRPSGRTARPAVSGTIVEHTSWRNPGRVSSWVRVPPPIVRRGLVDLHGAPGAGQGQGRGQAVRARRR